MTIAEVACIQRTDGVKSIQCHLGWDVHTAQLRSWYKNIVYKVIQSWLHCMVKLIWSFMMGSLLAGFSSQSLGRNGGHWFHQNTISQGQIHIVLSILHLRCRCHYDTTTLHFFCFYILALVLWTAFYQTLKGCHQLDQSGCQFRVCSYIFELWIIYRGHTLCLYYCLLHYTGQFWARIVVSLLENRVVSIHTRSCRLDHQNHLHIFPSFVRNLCYRQFF